MGRGSVALSHTGSSQTEILSVSDGGRRLRREYPHRGEVDAAVSHAGRRRTRGRVVALSGAGASNAPLAVGFDPVAPGTARQSGQELPPGR